MLAVLNRRQLLKRAAQVVGWGAAAAAFPLGTIRGEDAKEPSRFQYAFCNESFEGRPFDKMFGFLAECGYQAVEIAPSTIGGGNVADVSAARRAEIRRLAEKAGLKVVGLHWLLAKTTGCHLTSRDATIRRNTIAYLSELAKFCADLGGKIMVLGSPQQRNLPPGVGRDDGMKYAAEVISAVAPVLKECGVVLALEPLGASETNFLNTAGEAVQLMKLVNSPQCRLHLDCKAMAGEPTPIPDLIRRHRADFVHFHANDPNRQGPGFGKLDFVPILKTLREVGYRGWVSVEPTDFSAGPERAARESIKYLRRCEQRI